MSQLALLLAFASLTAAACGEGSTSTSNSIRQYNDTWLWNGADWTEAHSAISPSPRTAPALAYDEATHQLVLFGGRSTTGDLSFFDDTWTWDGDAWTQQHPAHSPGGRDEAGLVYDAKLRALILIGGFVQKSQADGSTFLGGLRDVWRWDGSDWNEVGSTPVPLTLYISDKAAFDPESKEVVAIGDLETTSWDGSAWSQVPNPKNWFGVDVTYVDPTTRRLTALVAFANPDNSLTYRLESWQAGAWDDGPVVALPLVMDQGWLDVAAATYDSKRKQVVIFGGGCMDHPGNQTLLFDGTGWSVAEPADVPPGRTYAYMAFDSDRAETVMFGGSTSGAVLC